MSALRSSLFVISRPACDVCGGVIGPRASFMVPRPNAVGAMRARLFRSVGSPFAGGTIVLEPGRALECLLGGVHDQIGLVVLVDFTDSVEWDRDVLLADSEKAPDADHGGRYLAVVLAEQIS